MNFAHSPFRHFVESNLPRVTFVLARLRQNIDLGDFACRPKVYVLQPEAAEFNPAGGGVVGDLGDAIGEFRFRIAGCLPRELFFFLLVEDFARAPTLGLRQGIVRLDCLSLVAGAQHRAEQVQFMVDARVTGHLPAGTMNLARYANRIGKAGLLVRLQHVGIDRAHSKNFEKLVQRPEVLDPCFSSSKSQLIRFDLCAYPDSSSVQEFLSRHAVKVGLYESVVSLARWAVDVIDRMPTLWCEIPRQIPSQASVETPSLDSFCGDSSELRHSAVFRGLHSLLIGRSWHNVQRSTVRRISYEILGGIYSCRFPCFVHALNVGQSEELVCSQRIE